MCNIGACIVNKDNVIVGVGYNGLPRGMDEIPKIYDQDYKSYNQHNQFMHGNFKGILHILYVTYINIIDNKILKLFVTYSNILMTLLF